MVFGIFLEGDLGKAGLGKCAIFYLSDFLGDHQFTGLGFGTPQQDLRFTFCIQLIKNAIDNLEIFRTFFKVDGGNVAAEVILETLDGYAAPINDAIDFNGSCRECDLLDLTTDENKVALNAQGFRSTGFKVNAGQRSVAECAIANHLNGVGNNKFVTQRCAIEGICADFTHSGAKGQSLQFGVAIKGTVADIGNLAIRAHGEGFQSFDQSESIGADHRYTVAHYQRCNLGALENTITLVCQGAQAQRLCARRKSDGSQFFAIIKRAISNNFQIGGNMNGGDVGSRQSAYAQFNGIFRNGETGQAGSFKCVSTDNGGALGQFNRGQQNTFCKGGSAKGHLCDIAVEGNLRQFQTTLESTVANGHNVLANMNFCDLGVALEDLITDLLRIGMQLAQIAVLHSGIEQQFFITGGIQSAIPCHKVGIGRIDNDIRNGVTTGKHGAIKITEAGRQMDRCQSGAAFKHIGAKSNFFLAGSEGYLTNTFTVLENSAANRSGANGNDSHFQLLTTSIGCITNGDHVGAFFIGNRQQLFIAGKCPLAN